MIEREAIKVSLKMWRWLAGNPTKNKSRYYLAKKMNDPGWNGDCACCEYYRIESRFGKCPPCPLQDSDICAFNEPGSAFNKWYQINQDPLSFESFSLSLDAVKVSKECATKIKNILQKYWDDNFKGNRKKKARRWKDGS